MSRRLTKKADRIRREYEQRLRAARRAARDTGPEDVAAILTLDNTPHPLAAELPDRLTETEARYVAWWLAVIFREEVVIACPRARYAYTAPAVPPSTLRSSLPHATLQSPTPARRRS